MRATLTAFASVALCFGGVASAQTLVGIYGSPGSANGAELWEFHGPAKLCAPACAVQFEFPAAPPSSVCPGVPSFPFNHRGDVAHDLRNDVHYLTDGLTVGRYTADGVQIDQLPSATGLTGLGFDSANQLLWYTDGFHFDVLPAPPFGTCGAIVPVIPAPTIPLGGSAGPLATDIEWDPTTGSLVACFANGTIRSYNPGGGPGAFPPVNVGGLPWPCPVSSLFLTGISVDTTQPGTGAVTVVNEFNEFFSVELASSAPQPGVLHNSQPCWQATCLPAPLSGLAQTLHSIRHGNPSGAAPGVTLDTRGNSHVFSTTFTAELSGLPGDTYLLFYSLTGPACPGIPSGSLQIFMQPAYTLYTLGSFPLSGQASLPLPPMPPAPGFFIEMQALGLSGPALSSARHFTIGAL
jgi:hypothetical protein